MSEEIEVEKRWVKLDHIDQIIKCPESYIGKTKLYKSPKWVMSSEGIQYLSEAEISDGFLRVVNEEPLNNCTDNKERDSSMTYIKYEYLDKSGYHIIENDGVGIPIAWHKTENMHLIQLIFGNMFVSENYNAKKKSGVGQNGEGVKFLVIMCEEFTVTVVDIKSQQKYQQTWYNNMKICGQPEIIPFTCTKGMVQLKFKPSYDFFKIKDYMKTDLIRVTMRRMYDIAATNPTIKCFFNGKPIKLKSFQEYAEMYADYISKKTELDKKRLFCYCKCNEKCEFALIYTPDSLDIDDGQKIMTFVNGAFVPRGGQHVKVLTKHLTELINKILNFKASLKTKITKESIFKRLLLVANFNVDGPKFDSKSKLEFIECKDDLDEICKFKPSFNAKLKDTFIIDYLSSAMEEKDISKSKTLLAKSKNEDHKRIKIKDAHYAGKKTNYIRRCWFCEGDSGGEGVYSGINSLENGREYNGVVIFSGKNPNVSKMSYTDIANHHVYSKIIITLGLKPGEVYTSTKKLRYDQIVCLFDKDDDGYHILGQVFALFAKFWPSLLKLKDFTCGFWTPLISLKWEKDGSFYKLFGSEDEYNEWFEKNSIPRGVNSAEYYKGIGSHSSEEITFHFSNLEENLIYFYYHSEKCLEYILAAFDHEDKSYREKLIREFEPEKAKKYANMRKISFEKFIKYQLTQYYITTLTRSIPHLMDGNKEVERKILFTAFKTLKTKTKSESFIGLVLSNAMYVHGPSPLYMAMVQMAQNIIWRNNINILLPEGQYGIRETGGSRPANQRYTCINLNPISPYIYLKEDMYIIGQKCEEGHLVEPNYYIPIIPMILVNGGNGIATAWSTVVPMFNPDDIIDNLLRFLDGEDYVDMLPWSIGFKGTVVQKDQYYISKGIYECKGNEIHITELPMGVWSSNYMIHLKKLMETSKIEEVKEYHTEHEVYFILYLTDEQMVQFNDLDLEKQIQMLKLENSFKFSNMNLLVKNEIIPKKFDNVKDIFLEFANERLSFFTLLKNYYIEDKIKDISIIENRIKYVNLVQKRILEIEDKSDEDILQLMIKHQFSIFDSTPSKLSNYDYLIHMPHYNMSKSKLLSLEQDLSKQKQKLEELKKMNENVMYKERLLELKKQWHIHLDKTMKKRYPKGFLKLRGNGGKPKEQKVQSIKHTVEGIKQTEKPENNIQIESIDKSSKKRTNAFIQINNIKKPKIDIMMIDDDD
jgi:DNA topoisomerase-2